MPSTSMPTPMIPFLRPPKAAIQRLIFLWSVIILAVVFTNNTAAAQTLTLRDQVISQDTTWSGEINIEGVVVVGKKATLQIAPGTRVSFVKIDRNHDGVGDGEIRVLGAIRAEGRPDSKIIFSSAASQPSPKDWSFLLVFSSPAVNRISWCEFHDAFSGLQVHFSTLTVENSVFSKNHEGLRFGRADLGIHGNLFTDNDVGIRFTRMEGPVRINGNEIHNNRIGLFLVPSGQNIRDFFEPDRSGTPWNTGYLEISGNNIHDNTWYNLDLGEKQLWDLDVTNNYWGSDNPEVIAAGIFDRRRDETLGLALFEPFASKRFLNRVLVPSPAKSNPE